MMQMRGWTGLPGWMRVGPALPVTLALLAVLLVAIPDRHKQPLVGADDWTLSEEGFVPSTGDPREVPQSLLQHPDSRFWTSWTPTGRREGTLSTAPFVLPSRGFGVPVRGFPGAPGIRVEATCVHTGESRVVSHARTNNEWAVATFDPGPDWCLPQRQVVMSVEARSQHHELAVGPPFKISWQYSLKSSALQAAAYLYLAWMVMMGVTWWLYLSLSFMASQSLRAAATLAGLGMVSYVGFFIFWSSLTAGSVFAVLLLVLGLAGFHRFIATGPGTGHPADQPRWFGQAGWLWLLVALVVLFVFRLPEVNAGPWSPNGRFEPASWSSDNQLPMRIGQMLATGHLADTGWMGSWRVSDRPPLSYGWHAVFSKLFGTRWSWTDGSYLLFQHAWPVGVLLNTLWAPVLLLIARRATGSHAMSLAIVAAALFSPFLLFNSGYIWPKLLSAAFGITAAWLLFGIGRAQGRDLPMRADDTAFVLAAVLSALALQSHGGAVFAVLAMLLIAPLVRGMPSFRAMAVSAVVCMLVLGPWMLYQKVVDPPGNALLKFAFAGTFGFGEEHIGVLETIKRSYAALTPDAWLQSKFNAIKTLVVGGGQCGLGEQSEARSLVDGWRSRDFLYVVPSMILLVAGALAARLLPRAGGARNTRSALWIVWAIVSLLLGALLTMDCHINHHQSYQALLAAHLGLLLAAAGSPIAFRLTLAVVLAYGIGVWVWDPLEVFARLDMTSWLVLGAALLLLPRVASPGVGALPARSLAGSAA